MQTQLVFNYASFCDRYRKDQKQNSFLENDLKLEFECNSNIEVLMIERLGKYTAEQIIDSVLNLVQNMKCLTLRNLSLTSDHIISLINGLNKLHYKLEALDLSNNAIGLSGFIAVTNYEFIDELLYLNLGSNWRGCGDERYFFGDSGATQLCERLSHADAAIAELNLSNCGLTNASIVSINHLLAQNKLYSLDLSYNLMSDHGLCCLFVELEHSNLSSLNISSQPLSHRALSCLIENIKKFQLTDLQMRNCINNGDQEIKILNATNGSKIKLLSMSNSFAMIKEREEILQIACAIKHNHNIIWYDTITVEIYEYLLRNDKGCIIPRSITIGGVPYVTIEDRQDCACPFKIIPKSRG